MIQVLYVSTTSEPMTAVSLLDLLTQCRKNNTEAGITGMLLYGNGTFLQAIEGEEDIVDPLVEKIMQDPRHAQIHTLHRKEIEAREYADWSMGYRQVTDDGLEEIEGLKQFGASDFTYDYLLGHEPVVATLMDHYRQPHWDELTREVDAKDKVIEHLKRSLAEVRNQTQVTRLALESVIEATRKDLPKESLLELCDAALDAIRRR